MALTTTIYDATNACVTGNYFTYRGECVYLEFTGSSVECLDLVDTLIRSDDVNEVVHIIVRPNARMASPVAQHSNPLFSAWANPNRVTV